MKFSEQQEKLLSRFSDFDLCEMFNFECLNEEQIAAQKRPPYIDGCYVPLLVLKEKQERVTRHASPNKEQRAELKDKLQFDDIRPEVLLPFQTQEYFFMGHKTTIKMYQAASGSVARVAALEKFYSEQLDGDEKSPWATDLSDLLVRSMPLEQLERLMDNGETTEYKMALRQSPTGQPNFGRYQGRGDAD